MGNTGLYKHLPAKPQLLSPDLAKRHNPLPPAASRSSPTGRVSYHKRSKQDSCVLLPPKQAGEAHNPVVEPIDLQQVSVNCRQMFHKSSIPYNRPARVLGTFASSCMSEIRHGQLQRTHIAKSKQLSSHLLQIYTPRQPDTNIVAAPVASSHFKQHQRIT